MKLNKKKINLILTIIESLLGKTIVIDKYIALYSGLMKAKHLFFKKFSVKIKEEEFKKILQIIKDLEEYLDKEPITPRRAMMLSRYMLTTLLVELPSANTRDYKVIESYRNMFECDVLPTVHQYYLEYYKAKDTQLFFLINSYMDEFSNNSIRKAS